MQVRIDKIALQVDAEVKLENNSSERLFIIILSLLHKQMKATIFCQLKLEIVLTISA